MNTVCYAQVDNTMDPDVCSGQGSQEGQHAADANDNSDTIIRTHKEFLQRALTIESYIHVSS